MQVVIRCARSQCKLQPSPWPTLVTRCAAIFRKCATAPGETGDEKTAKRKSEWEERESEKKGRIGMAAAMSMKAIRGTKWLPHAGAPRAALPACSRSIFIVNPTIDDQATEGQPASTVDRSRTNSCTWTELICLERKVKRQPDRKD
jgi:hypothetical protein